MDILSSSESSDSVTLSENSEARQFRDEMDDYDRCIAKAHEIAE
jgi:hypothetical protein